MTVLFTQSDDNNLLEVFEEEPGTLSFEITTPEGTTLVVVVDAADFARQLIGGSRTVATGIGEIVQRAVLSTIASE